MKKTSILLAICTAVSIAARAQTLTTLWQFHGTDGAGPGGGSGAMTLVQGIDGSLYGTTFGLGANGTGGTVFKITLSGALTTLHNFCSQQPACPDGAAPYGGLTLGNDGNFYGTTYLGAATSTNNPGTIFKITPEGTLTTLHRFCPETTSCPDGFSPPAGLVLGTDGNFYGVTSRGGTFGGGTLFKITPNGTLTTLYNFCSLTNCADGSFPQAGLVQGTDGNFYGTTWYGNGAGTVFRITPSGVLTTLLTDVEYPGALVQAMDGNFYGTTQDSQDHGFGSVFQITLAGAVKVLYSFSCSGGVCPDGEDPRATLVLGTDQNLYGTTPFGGEYGPGTIFQISHSGTLATLYNFDGNPGIKPFSGLMQATDGNFYGTTYGGNVGTDGTVFCLFTGLGPFVKTLPHNGHVGQVIRILGTNLTGASAVTFNGTAAGFTVVAPTEITATVPVGATTGPIHVTTPAGTLLSAGPFTVLP